MKKLSLIVIVAITLICATGCNNSNSNGPADSNNAPNSLVGTIWKIDYTYDGRPAYYMVEFKTSSDATFTDWYWSSYNNQYITDTESYTYTYEKPYGCLSDDDGNINCFQIAGNRMIGVGMIFTKQ